MADTFHESLSGSIRRPYSHSQQSDDLSEAYCNLVLLLVPSKAPDGVLVPNKTSPVSIRVQWSSVSTEYLHGQLQRYQIWYRAVKIGRERTLHLETFTKIVSPDDTKVTIDELEPYATYCVQVAAVTRKGSGTLSSAQCAGKGVMENSFGVVSSHCLVFTFGDAIN